MIIESIEEVKRLKQIIGLIQACTFPEMKGIDAFCIHNSLELIFNCCSQFEENEKIKLQKKEQKKDITEIAQEVQNHGMQKEEKESKVTKKTINRRGKKWA
jgi:hypothetical protein